jgi:hypothetical protein
MTGRFRPTLRRVDIRFNRKMTLDIRPNLQPFIDVGLDVSTTHIQPFKVLSPWQGLSDAPDRPIMPPLASYW